MANTHEAHTHTNYYRLHVTRLRYRRNISFVRFRRYVSRRRFAIERLETDDLKNMYNILLSACNMRRTTFLGRVFYSYVGETINWQKIIIISVRFSSIAASYNIVVIRVFFYRFPSSHNYYYRRIAVYSRRGDPFLYGIIILLLCILRRISVYIIYYCYYVILAQRIIISSLSYVLFNRAPIPLSSCYLYRVKT